MRVMPRQIKRRHERPSASFRGLLGKTCWIFLCCVLCFGAQDLFGNDEATGAKMAAVETAKPQSAAPLGTHYLLLVNTAIARQLKPQDIAEFDKSPYDGLAVAFHYNYDTAPVFSADTMSVQL